MIFLYSEPCVTVTPVTINKYLETLILYFNCGAYSLFSKFLFDLSMYDSSHVKLQHNNTNAYVIKVVARKWIYSPPKLPIVHITSVFDGQQVVAFH